MKRATTLLVGAAFLASASVALAQKMAPPPPGIEKTRTAYAAAVIAKDAKAVTALYAEDGVEMPPNTPAVKGRAAIQKFNQDLFDQFNPKIAITATDTKAIGDWAIDIGTYTQTLTPVKGGTPIKDTGKYIVILKQAGGQWWVTHAIYNSDLPPMPPPPAPKK
jgi:uncharacterized protein (TIGR02246 family)